MDGTTGKLESIWRKRFRRGPMDPLPAAELRPGRGMADNADQGGTRQITIVSQERWKTVSETMGVAADPRLRRANLLVSGIDLENTRGKILRVGDCRLQVKGETRPCERMEEALPGLQAALDTHWGGGVYAEVIDGGVIRIGDEVAWSEAGGEDRT